MENTAHCQLKGKHGVFQDNDGDHRQYKQTLLETQDIDGCSFWLGTDLLRPQKSHCGKELFNQFVNMFLTFASNKDSAIVALFVQALLMNTTEPSYQAFMDQATRFANAVMRSRDEVLSLVHASYEEEKESFVH